MKKPKFEWNDKVEFYLDGMDTPKVGVIEVVDAFGTYFQREFPSYDICVTEENNSLYKHVPEPYIRRKVVGSESITRGVLQYDEKLEKYSVVYGFQQYAVLLDNPAFMEIRLEGMLDWVSVAFVEKELPKTFKEDWMHIPIASLKEWVGKSVEIRYIPPHMMVCDLIYSHQDDSNMIYEVYKEDANVVLFDGGEVEWNSEDLVLRGARHHVVNEYYNNRVYRWDVVDGVMRLCLGHISEPKPETLDSVKEWKERMEARELKVPNVDEKNIIIVEHLRREEFGELGLKRMIAYAAYICRVKNVEILTPVTQYGFEYKEKKNWHKVYYKPGWIYDAMVYEEE